IPDTALTDCSDLRQKTVKAGSIARALAVFRVIHVYVYDTGTLVGNKKRDADLLTKILRFMDTPQYLRKRIFPKSPSLKYAGILPPLRTRSHPLESKQSELEEGVVRWGVQVRPGKVDLGLERPVNYPKTISERDPTLFRVKKTSPQITLEIIDRDDVEEYWGFTVERVRALDVLLEESDDSTRIGFSRKAPHFDRLEEDLKSTIAGTQSVLAVFGGPGHGILEVFNEEREAIKSNIDFWVNTIPDQGTETVRLDEALLVSLGVLNNSMGQMIAKPGFHE
ncbi:MAG: putative RNA uridine N3 methyltransferase, partial [Candidatus Thorarchaeota archaeon]